MGFVSPKSTLPHSFTSLLAIPSVSFLLALCLAGQCEGLRGPPHQREGERREGGCSLYAVPGSGSSFPVKAMRRQAQELLGPGTGGGWVVSVEVARL